MRKSAFVCLMDIQSLCVYQDELYINPYFEELLHVLSADHIQEAVMFNHMDLVLFGPASIVDCNNRICLSTSSQGDLIRIDFEDIALEIKSLTINFHTKLNAETGNEKRNRLYFHEPKFCSLDTINSELLKQMCEVNQTNQIVVVSANHTLLEKAKEVGCVICPLYDEGDWNSEDLNALQYYLAAVTFSQVIISLSEAVDTLEQRKKCIDYFERQFPDKKLSLVKFEELDFSSLEGPDKMIVHFEENADKALSLSLQYESPHCHIIRIHSCGEFPTQLTSIVSKWLAIETKTKAQEDEKKSIPLVTVKTSETQTIRVGLTTEGTQTIESPIAPEVQGFDSCDVELGSRPVSQLSRQATQHSSSPSTFFNKQASDVFHHAGDSLKELTSQTWNKLSGKLFGK